MATYTITSKTLWGNTCEITLTTASGSGGVLTPASEPFEMETDDSTEIDTVLRTTTGTVRFIVEDASVLDYILPTTLLGTKVEVKLNGTVKFFGYVELTEYSQPWDSTPYEMELPVRDVISLLEDIYLEPNDSSYFGTSLCFSQYLTEAMNALGFTPSGVDIECSSDCNILTRSVQREWFISEDVSYNESGTKSMTANGCSYDEVLEKILLPNAMSLRFEDGYLRLRRHWQSTDYYRVSWSTISTLTPSSSVSFSSTGTYKVATGDGFDGLCLTNMSASNTLNHLTPCRSVQVKESLEDTNMFEFDEEWCGDWNLSVIRRNGDKAAYYWQNDGTSQRNVTVARHTITSSFSTSTVSDTYRIDTVGINGNPIVGGVIADIQEYDNSANSQPASMPTPSTPTILTLPWKYETNSSHGSLSVEMSFADFYCPVSVNPSKGGCICFNAKVDLMHSHEVSDGRTIPEINYDVGSGTFIYAMFELLPPSGGSSRYFYQGTWRGTSPGLGNISPILFDKDGNIVGNFDGNYANCAGTSGDSHNITYSYGALTQSERFKYKDCDGFIIPLDDISTYNGEYRLHVRLFSAFKWGGSSSSSADTDNKSRREDHWQWLVNDNFWQYVSGIKVSWHPVIVTGTLPDPGSSESGTFSAQYTPLPEEKTYIFNGTSESGEDLDVDLDSWGDTDNKKWGNTLQANLADTTAWQSVAMQHVGSRRVVEYDDARFTGDALEYYRVGGRYYIQVGNAWKASNEGGKKKFVQVIRQ